MNMRRIVVWMGDWLCRFLRVVFDVLAFLLPLERTSIVADLLGFIILFGKRGPSTARISLALGDGVPRKAIQQIWVGYKRHVGMTLREIALMEVMNPDELRRFVKLDGDEHLHSVLERNRGAVILFNHFGNMACLAAGLGLRGHDISVVTNPMLFPSVDRRYDLMFERFRTNRFLTGNGLYFEASRVLRRNGLFASTIDYSVRTKRSSHGSWMPFGNAEILVNPGPAIIALRLGAPILFATCRRHEEGGYQLRIHPPIQHESSLDIISNARTIIQQGLNLLMDNIRTSPSEWWTWDNAPLRRKRMASAEKTMAGTMEEPVHALPTG